MVAVYSLDADDFTIAPEILLVLVHEGIMITHRKQLYYTCTTPPPKKTKATTTKHPSTESLKITYRASQNPS